MINPRETLRICGDATPGPWHRVFTDDSNHMSSVYVGTTDRGDRHDNVTGFDGSRDDEIVAATLYQLNPGIDHESGKWDENAALIVHAREALPVYAAWVKDALPFLEQARADACADGLLLAIDPESKECIEAHQRIFALMKLLARVKHE